jgi:signal transduction histidine kinase
MDNDALPITVEDERYLRIYFGMERPVPPGAQSSLGAMCTRLSREINPKTTEVPTPLSVDGSGNRIGAAWTEIIACGRAGGAPDDVEAALIAYVDARSGMQRVHKVLERLSAEQRAVLEAHYGEPEPAENDRNRRLGVASMTAAAHGENRSRAARDLHEPVTATIQSLALRSVDRHATKVERDAVRQLLRTIEREATALLGDAQTAYRCAQGRPPSCR